MRLSANGMEAWITVDGEEAEQFRTENIDEPSGQTCWIASQLNKPFSIHWRNIEVFCQTTGRLWVDGIECSGEIIRGPHFEAKVPGRRTSANLISPFIFSSIDLTDDDAFLDSAQHQDVGIIRLEIWTVTMTGTKPFNQVAAPPAESKIHERSKKGVAHQTKFGDPVVQGSSRSAAIIEYLENIPLVTFVFKYRSIDILRANGIAPPVVSGKRKATVGSVKQEDKGPKRVKKEEPSQRPAEIIDLTRSETPVATEVIDLT